MVAAAPGPALGAPQRLLSFENADIQTVIEEVARLTGTAFLYDPARVKGTVTVLAPGDITAAQAVELLRSALALHGYVLVARPEGVWIVPAPEAAGARLVVRTVRLTYVDAEEVALTLSWAAPPGVRIAPFYPTNSVVISGPEAAVEQLVDVIHRR